jgi:hypothetical protein
VFSISVYKAEYNSDLLEDSPLLARLVGIEYVNQFEHIMAERGGAGEWSGVVRIRKFRGNPECLKKFQTASVKVIRRKGIIWRNLIF